MTGNPFPHGFGGKVHPSHPAHKELFAHRPDSVPFVACKFHRSSWFVNQPRFQFLHPDQDLFITTYESDRHLLGRTPRDEVDRYEKLEDDVQGVFPGDRFTYADEMNRRELVKEIEESVQRQLTVQDLMENIDLPVFPCIMGWEDWHFERCRPLVDEISRSVGFDATQYYSKYRLKKHIETMEEVLDVERVFVNGRIAPAWLKMLPKCVVACSGAWNIRQEAKDASGTLKGDRMPDIAEERVDALNEWQSDITNFL